MGWCGAAVGVHADARPSPGDPPAEKDSAARPQCTAPGSACRSGTPPQSAGSANRASAPLAPPSRAAPSGANRLPQTGQSQECSTSFQASAPPSRVQTPDTLRTTPSTLLVAVMP